MIKHTKTSKNIENKEKNRNIPANTYSLGLQGQDFVELKFINVGYKIFQKNFKKIGLEIDLIVYKYIKEKNLLVIRIVEVKTRKKERLKVDLEEMGIKGKWRKVKSVMFDIPRNIKGVLGIDNCPHTISFDLAVVQVESKEIFVLNTYIKNVDLLL